MLAFAIAFYWSVKNSKEATRNRKAGNAIKPFLYANACLKSNHNYNCIFKAVIFSNLKLL